MRLRPANLWRVVREILFLAPCLSGIMPWLLLRPFRWHDDPWLFAGVQGGLLLSYASGFHRTPSSPLLSRLRWRLRPFNKRRVLFNLLTIERIPWAIWQSVGCALYATGAYLFVRALI